MSILRNRTGVVFYLINLCSLGVAWFSIAIFYFICLLFFVCEFSVIYGNLSLILKLRKN